MKTYSLIVPHYDDFERLKRLLRSVPERDDLEIIVVDDCSPNLDAYCKIKRSWGKVRFVRLKDNAGAGAARNVGLSYVTGKYVLFADSDDEFLGKTFDVLDQRLGGEDITYFFSEAVQEKSGLPSVRTDVFNSLCLEYLVESTEENLNKLRFQHCVPWAKVYSSDFLKKIDIRFDETFVSNDVYFNIIAAAKANSFKVIDDCLYRVYRLTDSLTSTESSDRLVERVKVAARVARSLKSLGVNDSRSATGYILLSVKYGALVFIKVLWIAITSDLKIDVFRVFDISRWRKFRKQRKIRANEINGGASVGRR